jgi:hypothetical protein
VKRIKTNLLNVKPQAGMNVTYCLNKKSKTTSKKWSNRPLYGVFGQNLETDFWQEIKFSEENTLTERITRMS